MLIYLNITKVVYIRVRVRDEEISNFQQFAYIWFSPGQDVFNDVHNNKRKICESIVDVAGTVSLTIDNGFDSVIVGFDNLEKIFPGRWDNWGGRKQIEGTGSKSRVSRQVDIPIF